MKIAELFAVLGFQVSGEDKVDAVDKKLDQTEHSATKATLAVAAFTTGMLYMVDTAMHAAVALRNYATATGLSTDELQRFQRVATGLNVPVEEVAETLKAIQSASAKIKMGGPASGLWGLLGVTPHQDPMKVMEGMRRALLQVKDLGIAREMAKEVGISENMFRVLVSTQEEFDRFNKGFITSKAQVDALAKLSRAWQLLKFDLAQVKNQLLAALVPVFRLMIATINLLIKPLGMLAKWMEQGSTTATAFRWVMMALIAGLVLFTGVATLVAAATSTMAGSLIALTAAAWRVLIPLAAIAWQAVAIAAILASIVLVVDDIITSFQGGDSVTRRIGEWLAGLKAIEAIITKIWALWDFDQTLGKKMHMNVDMSRTYDENGLPIPSNSPTNTAPVGTTNNVTSSVKVDVNGAQNPEATAREVGAVTARHLSDVYNQGQLRGR